MRANSMCTSCIISRQEKQIRNDTDEAKKNEYMHRVLEIVYQNWQTQSAPWMAEKMNRLYEEYWGPLTDYTEIKHQYNQLLLGKEKELEAQIRASADPIKECIKYVCVANYIDFSAVKDLSEEKFEELLEKAKEREIPEAEYSYFTKDVENAKRLVYLTDNCGEIVLDKIFIRFLQESYPNLQITAIVRGGDVINDATMADAEEVGLTELVPCISNGNLAPSTILEELSKEARECIEKADVIISKGQGNFEGLFGEGLNPYYFFLCKCELFVHRFGLPQFESIFRKEERIRFEKASD